MFGGKHPNYTKLRTNLRLCINRLKLLEKKKAELALKARKEIADYISMGKEDRARIRVEHIVREDYLVEAMEMVEMLCDLLLARFGLIDKMKELDPGLEEAVATLIWVTPRLSADIAELKEVSNQLTIKYGKEFAEMCRRNQFETVHEKVMLKLSTAAPPKILVENYMVEIAKSFKVPFEPDPFIMSGETVPEVSDLINLLEQTNDSKPPPDEKPGFGGGGGSYNGGGPGGGDGGGFTGFGGGGGGGIPNYPQATGPPEAALYPPGNTAFAPIPPAINQPNIPGPMHGLAPVFVDPAAHPHNPGYISAGRISPAPPRSPGAPPLPGRPPNASQNNSPSSQGASPNQPGSEERRPPHINITPDLPKYDDVVNSPTQYPPAGSPSTSVGSNTGPRSFPSNTNPQEPNIPPQGSDSSNLGPRPVPKPRSSSPRLPDFPEVPGLPSVPAGSVGSTSAGGDEVDFDDLTRRFEELKRRK